jgi:hypothetical protein
MSSPPSRVPGRHCPVALALALAACDSSSFVPVGPPDAHVNLDLADTYVAPPAPDGGCFNTACGGCSSWAKWDGSPARPGDSCLWTGTLSCTGTSLTCSDSSCLACPKQVSGTVCGADGHTIVELMLSGNSCSAYDFGSAIGVCNHGAQDQCLGRCTVDASGNYACAAHCASDDGGGTGCPHGSNDTCATLAGC